MTSASSRFALYIESDLIQQAASASFFFATMSSNLPPYQRQNSRSPAALLAPLPVGERTPLSPSASSVHSRQDSYFAIGERDGQDATVEERLLSEEPASFDPPRDRLDHALRRRGMTGVADFRGKATEWFNNNTGLLLIAAAQCFFAR
jgi:hypothetical protein